MAEADGAGVGLIGVGLMGGAMAARLCGLGWRVGVRDVDPLREAAAARCGATVHATATALADAHEAIVVAVVDAAQCDEALFGAGGAADGMRAGSSVLVCSTIGPADVERIAARLAPFGVDCIDAPMSGGPARARDGSMSLMVACDDALFERRRALLEALSSNVVRVGARVGDGARTKLVNNLLAAVNLAGACEAMALAERVGLDLATTLDVIERSSGRSWIASDRLRRVLAGDGAPQAATSLLAKDSRLALAMAGAAGADVDVGGAAAALFARACDAGFAARDDSSLLALLRSPAQRD